MMCAKDSYLVSLQSPVVSEFLKQIELKVLQTASKGYTHTIVSTESSQIDRLSLMTVVGYLKDLGYDVTTLRVSCTVYRLRISWTCSTVTG